MNDHDVGGYVLLALDTGSYFGIQAKGERKGKEKKLVD